MMRFIMLVVTLTLSCTAIGQKDGFSTYKNWNETKRLAKTSHKKIFLYFGATWCAPCVQIKKTILPDTGIQNQLKSDFVSYDFDIDQKSAVPFLKKYRISSVPLILVLNADGFVTNRIGEIPVTIPEFSDMLSQASQNQEFIKGISNSLTLHVPKFYDAYFDKGMKQFPDSIIVQSYLRSQNDLTSEVNWNVLTFFNKNDSYFFYIKEHEKRLIDLYGVEVKFKIVEMYQRISEKYVEARDSIHYNQLAKLVTGADDLQDVEAQRSFLSKQILFLGKTGMDWNNFIDKSRLCIQLYGNRQAYFICQYALLSRPNPAALEFLLEAMKPLLETRPNANLYFMYGTLFWYLGNKNSAENYFQKVLLTTSGDQTKYYLKEIEEIKRG